MSRRYSSWRSLMLAEHPLEQHLGEPDHRVERRAQLVRHARQELRLVPAGDSSSALLPSSSRNSCALSMASADWLANVSSRSTTSRRRSRRARCAARPGRRRSRPSRSIGTASQGAPAVRRWSASRCGSPGASRRSATCDGGRRSSRRARRASRRGRCGCGAGASTTSGSCPGTRARRTAASPGRDSMIEPPSVPESSTACVAMVASTWSRSRLELTASPTSPSARSSSTVRASSRSRCCELLDQLDVVDRDRGLRREGGDEPHRAVVERLDLVAPQRDHADDALVGEHRRAHHRCGSRPARRPRATRTQGRAGRRGSGRRGARGRRGRPPFRGVAATRCRPSARGSAGGPPSSVRAAVDGRRHAARSSPLSALHSRSAWRTTVSNTGSSSNAPRPMTSSTSLVACRWSIASASRRRS